MDISGLVADHSFKDGAYICSLFHCLQVVTNSQAPGRVRRYSVSYPAEIPQNIRKTRTDVTSVNVMCRKLSSDVVPYVVKSLPYFICFKFWCVVNKNRFCLSVHMSFFLSGF